VLSGLLDDGTIGLWQIKRMGGVAVVQDPNDARFGSMAQSALDNVEVNYCEPLDRLGPLLVRLVKSTTRKTGNHRPTTIMNLEGRSAMMEDTNEDIKKMGAPSQYVCPECGGTLFKIKEGRIVRYRCRVGHAYGEESLIEEQSETAEAALWEAMRALREKSDLLRDRAAGFPKGDQRRAELVGLSNRASEQAEQLKEIIEGNQMPPLRPAR
jgi:two-component system chemotaxis response regulator CheB